VNEEGAEAPERFYDVFPRIEEDFRAALDVSLHPRGPEMLYDLVRDLRLPPGWTAIDVGCGEGRHALQLAYDIMLGDALWHVYGMIGKLNRRVYLLSGQ